MGTHGESDVTAPVFGIRDVDALAAPDIDLNEVFSGMRRHTPGAGARGARGSV